MRKLLVVVLAATLLPATLQAQTSCIGLGSCTTVTTVQLIVPGIVSLDLGGATVNLNAPTISSLGSHVQSNGPTMTVRANKAWNVSVHANAAAWAYTGDNGGAKPLSDLTWSGASDGTYVAMTQTPAPVGSGARTSTATVPMFFRVLHPADPGDPRNAAGTYTLGLTFTITAP
jgi:hypothetical protein